MMSNFYRMLLYVTLFLSTRKYIDNFCLIIRNPDFDTLITLVYFDVKDEEYRARWQQILYIESIFIFASLCLSAMRNLECLQVTWDQ